MRTIIALGHNLGLKVLAEGVETDDQVDFLLTNGCDELQGYWFSRPVSSWRLRGLLTKKACRERRFTGKLTQGAREGIVAPMPRLSLTVLSLRYSSWSMRPWLVLTQAGARFETKTVELQGMGQHNASSLGERRALGSVRGLFPVLHVDGTPIHESLAICEYVAEAYPDAQLWPSDAMHRAQARAISCEMLSGFGDLRRELSCQLFGRVPALKPGPGARADIARVFEIWEESLTHSGGPFLFGRFSIADAMFYPVLTRFRTYRVAVPAELAAYAEALHSHPAVRALIERARQAPRIAHYDENLRNLGGDPDAALHSVA